ncbi:MAG: hypothetical protein RL230_839 [Pseudomonadota bacterium]|jgi:hypothetical protein
MQVAMLEAQNRLSELILAEVLARLATILT